MGCALMRFVPILSTLVLLLTACTSNVPSDKDVLISLTDDVIVPAYQAVAQDVAQLDQDIKVLCNVPSSASLEAARRSWRGARASWMSSEAMWFGPVMDRRSISLLDWSPIDAGGVDQLLAEEVRDVLAANQRGFWAIEHILFSIDALHKLSNSDSLALTYLHWQTLPTKKRTWSCWSGWKERSPGLLTRIFSRTDRLQLCLQALLWQTLYEPRSSSSGISSTCDWLQYWGSGVAAPT